MMGYYNNMYQNGYRFLSQTVCLKLGLMSRLVSPKKSPEESAKHLPGPHLQEHPTARRAVAEGYRGPDQGAQLFKHHETMAIQGLNPPKWFFTMKNYGLNPAHQK